MNAIVAGGVLLSCNHGGSVALSWGALAIVGACFCWAVDNNLSRKVSAADPVQIAVLKGLSAGTINFLLGLMMSVRIFTTATITEPESVGGDVSARVDLCLNGGAQKQKRRSLP